MNGEENRDKLLEEKAYLADLLSIYGSLLRKNVYQRMEAFYFEDFSLSEIAQNEGVSRNAVYESLLSGVKQLKKYEDKLGCYKKKEKSYALLDKLEECKDEVEKKKITEELKGVLRNGI